MNTQIGDIAGKIWRTLKSKGEMNVAQLKKTITADEKMILLALGWLAREDKLVFTFSGKMMKVSLKME